jgi:hypothetical protein
MRYLIERSSWLEQRKKQWDSELSVVLNSFHDIILEMINSLKEDFNDKSDPIEIHKRYLEYIESSFEYLEETIMKVKDEDTLFKFWNEYTLNISFWKESFKRMSENNNNYNSVFKLGYEIFNSFNRYLTKKKSEEYYNSLKEGENLDDKRKNVNDFLSEVLNDFKLRIVDLDAENIFDISNLDKKGTEDINLTSGDEVRYNMDNGEENIAIVSTNQEDLKEETNVRLVSKTSGEQFEIDKSDLIEIIPKQKTMNQEVNSKLKKIKENPDKLDKLNDYLDGLLKENHNIKKNSRPLTTTSNQVKRWLSNKNFKKQHVDNFKYMLKSIYEPLGYWGTIGKLEGIINLPWEEKSWSILNKLNTNFTMLSYLINEVNRIVVDKKKTLPFDFRDKKDGTYEFYREYERFFKFISKYKKEFFLKLSENDGSELINNLIGVIKKTSGSGEWVEKMVKRYIPFVFPAAENIERQDEEENMENDMLGGIDVSFNINGAQKSVQVKKVKGVFKKGDKYDISGTNLAKHYNIDYLVCVSENYIHFFNYNADKIYRKMNGDLSIDQDLIIKYFKYKKS